MLVGGVVDSVIASSHDWLNPAIALALDSIIAMPNMLQWHCSEQLLVVSTEGILRNLATSCKAR